MYFHIKLINFVFIIDGNIKNMKIYKYIFTENANIIQQEHYIKILLKSSISSQTLVYLLNFIVQRFRDRCILGHS